MLVCPQCRASILAKEQNARAMSFRNAEAKRVDAFNESFRDFWDWRIIDETGRELWASDLAKRYRHDTMPRPSRSSSKY